MPSIPPRSYLPLPAGVLLALAAASAPPAGGDSWLGAGLVALATWAPTTGAVLALPPRSPARLRFWLETSLAAGLSAWFFLGWIGAERFLIGLTPLEAPPHLQTLFDLVDFADDQSLLGALGSLWLTTTLAFAALRCLRHPGSPAPLPS